MKLPWEFACISVPDELYDMEEVLDPSKEKAWYYSYKTRKFSLDLENRSTPPAKSFIKEPPKLELKSLLAHLCYKFLGQEETLL
ncbi:hypothetical protein HAX54_027967, partial [Datura stramonium]|nr:hypothetical protein [Datura stramonium]